MKKVININVNDCSTLETWGHSTDNYTM